MPKRSSKSASTTSKSDNEKKTPFSDISMELTRTLTKTEKKAQGIFFTPPTLVDIMVRESISIKRIHRILEPSAGSGEFIHGIQREISGVQIDAIEYHPEIYKRSSSAITSTPKHPIVWIHGDFIQYRPSYTLYDLIIGNPPYVVIDKELVPMEYAQYMTGRPNLFVLFIIHSISLLEIGGILAFVIPKSFLNSGYYGEARNYMKANGRFLNIIDFEKEAGFLETQQTTIGFIFQKTEPHEPTECAYSLQLGKNFVLSDNADKLRELFIGSTTLANMGLSVKTGNIVWNQKKDVLTDDETQTLLLYNSNITGNRIQIQDFANDSKKQYIQMAGTNEEVIVVNRGNGNSAYKHTYAFIDGTTPYLVENHLNVIYSATLSGEDLKRAFQTVLASFQDPRTDTFIKTFLGNNGLSKTELETIFPIYVHSLYDSSR
jgi:adenine-specific DNA-methyltransferase